MVRLGKNWEFSWLKKESGQEKEGKETGGIEERVLFLLLLWFTGAHIAHKPYMLKQTGSKLR